MLTKFLSNGQLYDVPMQILDVFNIFLTGANNVRNCFARGDFAALDASNLAFVVNNGLFSMMVNS